MKVPMNFVLDDAWYLSEDAEVSVSYPYPNKPQMALGRLVSGSVYGYSFNRPVRLYNGTDGRKVRFTQDGLPYGGNVEILQQAD